MAKKIHLTTAIFFAATTAMAILYGICHIDILLTLTITFGTVLYHFSMRLIVGLIFNTIMHNTADITKKRYQVGAREMCFYKKLKIKKLSRKMPTYDFSSFDPKLHSWEEIAQATCQAEDVHKTIVVLSFLPIISGIWFGAYPVFIITSVLSAAFDSIFVIIQRYNRQRIVTMTDRKRKLRGDRVR